MHKYIGILALMAFGFISVGCGGGSKSSAGNVNGTWTATLTNPDGSPAFAFSTDFTQSGSTGLSVTNFSFSTSGSCFSSPTSETGSFSFGGNFNGNVTGTFGLTISTMFPANNNVLALNGAVTGNTITGTWTLTGATGCSGNGSFTFNKKLSS